MSWVEHWIYPELNLERNSRCNLSRLQRGQQTGKAWLGGYLNCITPVRFSVGGTDKGATEYRGFMSDQLIVFSSGVFVMVCKSWHLREVIWQRSREIFYFFHNDQTYILLELCIILLLLITFIFDYRPSDL